MPFNSRSSNYEIELPIKGVDRGTVRAKPLPGTCPDCRNVRGWDLRDRLGVGKRSGSIVAFTDRAGKAGARRVTGLIRRSRISTVVSTSIPFTESAVDTTSGGNTFAASATSATYGDHGDNFVRYVVDQGATSILADTLDDRVQGAGPAFTADFYHALSSGGTSRHPHLISAFYTTNDVTATFSFIDTATTNEDGVANECMRIGPAIRGLDRGASFVMAMLRRQGANTVRLEIVTVSNGAVSSSLVQGATKTLLASAATTSCVLRCWESGDNVSASISWPGALVGPADYTETIVVSTTQNTGSKRGGVIGAWSTEAASALWRRCTRIQFTKLVPVADEVLIQLAGTQTNPSSGDRYFLPTGWKDVAVTRSSGAVAITTGFQSSAGDPTYIAVDDTSNTIRHTTTPGTTTLRWLQSTTAAFDDNSSYGVDWLTTKALGASPANEGLGFAWKVATDGTQYAAIAVNCRTSTHRSESGVCWFQNGGFSYGSSAATVERSLNLGVTSSAIPVRTGVRTRWSATSTGVSLYQNGIPIYTYAFTGTEQTALANFAGHGYGALFNINSTDYCSDCSDVRFVVVQSNPSGVGDTYSQIAAFTPQCVQIGDLRTGLLQDTTGTYLTNGSPAGFFFTGTGKFYAVDGTRSIVIDPSTLNAIDWAASPGTFPAGCHLACLFRGRAILARQDTAPNAYFASRVFDPLDFSYGASPLATSAFTGSNGNIGAPPDAITALIPFSDDYLLFGCASSLWMLEGDPGYDGAIQNMSQQTGILGPRAFCFDEQGNLYFMGTGGLYKLVRGSRDPENLSGQRLAERLDRVDTSSVLVQMVYDSFKGCVHIWLTQFDYSNSIHIVYDARRDAFWIDDIPQNSDPWSCTEIVGSEDEDRRIVWGGNDGYVRRWDDATASDHSTDFPTDGSSDTATQSVATIDSFVRFAPVESRDAMQDLLLTALQFQGASENGATSWEILTADSAEDVGDKLRGTGDRSGTVFGDSAGHQQIVRTRLRAGVHQLVTTQNSSTLSYSLERVVAMFAPVGQRR